MKIRIATRGSELALWQAHYTKSKLEAAGATVENVTQRSKHVVIVLSTGVLTSHLMFKGRWSIAGDDFTSHYKHHKEPPTAKSVNFWIGTRSPPMCSTPARCRARRRRPRACSLPQASPANRPRWRPGAK